MTDVVFLAAVTGGGFIFMGVWMLSMERSIASIEKQLRIHWDYMKSLDRQAGHELEFDKLHFGLNQKEVNDET